MKVKIVLFITLTFMLVLPLHVFAEENNSISTRQTNEENNSDPEDIPEAPVPDENEAPPSNNNNNNEEVVEPKPPTNNNEENNNPAPPKATPPSETKDNGSNNNTSGNNNGNNQNGNSGNTTTNTPTTSNTQPRNSNSGSTTSEAGGTSSGSTNNSRQNERENIVEPAEANEADDNNEELLIEVTEVEEEVLFESELPALNVRVWLLERYYTGAGKFSIDELANQGSFIEELRKVREGIMTLVRSDVREDLVERAPVITFELYEEVESQLSAIDLSYYLSSIYALDRFGTEALVYLTDQEVMEIIQLHQFFIHKMGNEMSINDQRIIEGLAHTANIEIEYMEMLNVSPLQAEPSIEVAVDSETINTPEDNGFFRNWFHSISSFITSLF